MKRKCLSLRVILVTLLSLALSQSIPSQLQSSLDTPAYLDQYQAFLKNLSEKGQLYQSIQENIIVRPSALQIQQLKALLDQAKDVEAQFNQTVNSKKTDPTVTLITRAQLYAKQIQVKRLLSGLIAALSSWIYKYDAQNPGTSSATLTKQQSHIYQQSGLPQPALISSRQTYVQMPPSQQFIPQPPSQPVLQSTQQSNRQPQQPPLFTRVTSQSAQLHTSSPLPIQVQPIFLPSFVKQPQASALKLAPSSMTSPAGAIDPTRATPHSASSVPQMANIIVSKLPSTIVAQLSPTIPPMKAQVIAQPSMHKTNLLLTPDTLQNQSTRLPISVPINVTIKPSADEKYQKINSTQLKQQVSTDSSPSDDAKSKQTSPDSPIEQASPSVDSKPLSNRHEAELLVASGAGAAISAVAITAGIKLGAAHRSFTSSKQTAIPSLINSLVPINSNQTTFQNKSISPSSQIYIPNDSNTSNVVANTSNVVANTSNVVANTSKVMTSTVSAKISNKLDQLSPEYYSYKKRFEQMEMDVVSFNESAQAIFQSKYQHQTLTPEEIEILSAVYDQETKLETEVQLAWFKISVSGSLQKEQKAKLSRPASVLLSKQKELRMSLEVVMHSFREEQVKTNVEAKQAVPADSRPR